MTDTEKYWNILKGKEIIVDEIAFLFNKTKEESSQMANNWSNFDIFWFSLGLKHIAYEKLISLGEINGEEIYHINAPNEPRQMDVAFKGKETLILQNGKWESTK